VDAVPVEPKGSSGIPYAGASADLTDQVSSLSGAHALPMQDGSTRITCGMGTGKTLFTFSLVRAISASKGPMTLSDITNEVERTQALLAELDEDESADALSALRFAANGDTVRLGRHDLAVYGPNNFAVIECKSFHDPVRAAREDSDRGRRRPAALVVDEEAGAHWRALPAYTRRSFTLQACCTMSVPASVSNVIGPSVPEATSSPEDEWACILLIICEKYPPCASIRTTTQSRRLVRDYHEGLRRFLFRVLMILRSMAVTLLAALSHQVQAATFLLVMLAVARHYGRRGDGDGHVLPVPALQPKKQQGAVCLAA
jgi:hypothetical protein